MCVTLRPLVNRLPPVDLRKTANNTRMGLFQACIQRSRDSVTSFLRKGANPNEATQDGQTALYICGKSNEVGLAEELIQHGASVHKQTLGGIDPLYVACSRGHVEVASLLLHNGADPYRKNHIGLSAIHAAARNSHFDILRILGAHGINLGILRQERDSNKKKNEMPLRWEVCDWVEYTIRRHWTPVDYAMDLRSVPITRWLICNGLTFACPRPTKCLHENYAKTSRDFDNYIQYLRSAVTIEQGFATNPPKQSIYLMWIMSKVIHIRDVHIHILKWINVYDCLCLKM